MKKIQNGFAVIAVLIIIVLLGVIAFLILRDSKGDNNNSFLESINHPKSSEGIRWNYDFSSEKWVTSGTPPDCPDPLIIPSPAEVTLATSVLYPGQIRGTDYKPHGGFRFDNLPSNELDVYTPMDGNLYQAARHLEGGEVQYSLYFINDCGIMYKLDHLRELTDKFNKILDKIPMGAEGDSRTTFIEPQVFFPKGEQVAVKVGIEKSNLGVGGRNVFFDYGVYDLRKPNGTDYSEEFLKNQPNINYFGTHAICWLDNLPEDEKSVVYSLPGADSTSGTKSDYCK